MVEQGQQAQYDNLENHEAVYVLKFIDINHLSTCSHVQHNQYVETELLGTSGLEMHRRSAAQSQMTQAGISLPPSCKEVCSVLPAAQHHQHWDGLPPPDVRTYRLKSHKQPQRNHTHQPHALTHINTTAHPGTASATFPAHMHPTIVQIAAQFGV